MFSPDPFQRHFQRWARRALTRIVGMLFRRRARPLSLPRAPRILVIRVDPRLGNVVMLLPLLQTLKLRLPDAQIDVLAHERHAKLIARHPAVHTVRAYRKRALISPLGPIGTIRHLRGRPYDVALDVGNPTDPSTTQALLTRFSGAHWTVGFDDPAFRGLYDHAVRPPSDHEIRMRLCLLDPWLPGATDDVPRLSAPPTTGSVILNVPFALLHVGARSAKRRIPVTVWARIVDTLAHAHLTSLVVFGPGEEACAHELRRLRAQVVVAPPTTVDELMALLAAAQRTVTPDTGVLHLSVALGVPTCGVFKDSDVARYGYAQPPHLVVDLRGGEAQAIENIVRWVPWPDHDKRPLS